MRIGLVRSAYSASGSNNFWPQAKYFSLRLCMLGCICYLIYEIVYVRFLLKKLKDCRRRKRQLNHPKRKNSEENLAKKELVDFEAEINDQGQTFDDELDFSYCSSD